MQWLTLRKISKMSIINPIQKTEKTSGDRQFRKHVSSQLTSPFLPQKNCMSNPFPSPDLPKNITVSIRKFQYFTFKILLSNFVQFERPDHPAYRISKTRSLLSHKNTQKPNYHPKIREKKSTRKKTTTLKGK